MRRKGFWYCKVGDVRVLSAFLLHITISKLEGGGVALFWIGLNRHSKQPNTVVGQEGGDCKRTRKFGGGEQPWGALQRKLILRPRGENGCAPPIQINVVP